jgi:hypothetical protein
MEEVDAFRDKWPLLYLIRETRNITEVSELRGAENQHYGGRHFV